jgi:CHAD domain-containing protein
MRLFSTLIPDEVCRDVRATLRQIRLAADQARNWDVLSDMFLHCPDVSGAGVVCTIVEEIARRRQAAQQPLVAVYRELLGEEYHERIESLLVGLPSVGKHEAKQDFGRHARAYFKTVLKKFSQAAAADLSDDEALHRFRICTKKIRYTMEMVAVAFEPTFRKELYPQVSLLQDILGIVNDHAMGKVFFHDWSLRAHDAQEKAFLEGLVLAEARAQRDVRQAFSALWTPKSVAELLRQFNLHCGPS